MAISDTCSILNAGNQNDIINLFTTIKNSPEGKSGDEWFAQVELTFLVHVIATGIDVQEKTKFMEPLLIHLAERSWNEQSKTNVNGNKRKPLIRLSLYVQQ